ncbi:RNA dependent RNA polymerase-domain-containing protein [Xylaria intraflava]|nr:RNA dependent RNA polymerase-domain-containing protein [Xylaria intraflava]
MIATIDKLAHNHLHRLPTPVTPTPRRPNSPTPTAPVAPIPRLPTYHPNRPRSSMSRHMMPPLGMKPDWADWDDLAVRLSSLPKVTTIRDLTGYFRHHGRIVFIEILEPKRASVTALIRFSPPPSTPFWQDPMTIRISGRNYRISAKLLPHRDPDKITTPEGNTYPAQLRIRPSRLQFGLLSQPDQFMAMRTVDSALGRESSFVVDLKARRVDIIFTCYIEDPRRADPKVKHDSVIGAKEGFAVYKARIFFPHLQKLAVLDEGESFSVLMPLESPPILFKRGDYQRSFAEGKSSWSELDLWNRAVGVVYDTSWFKDAPISLRGDHHFVDIGRCTTYKITFLKSDANAVWDTMKKALQDFNISIGDLAADSLHTVPAVKSNFWEIVEPAETANLALLAAMEVHLPFDVGYQLRVCISQGYLDVTNLDLEFLRRLSDLSSARKRTRNRALDLLTYVAESDGPNAGDSTNLYPKRFYDPRALFTDRTATSYYLELGTPLHCTWVRKVVITPSTMYLSTANPEPSNRVLRQYAAYADRFLRVQFTDELVKGRIFSSPNSTQQDALFNRVYRTLTNGIDIADRHFEFLAFGNSQFRENGAYFFAPTEYLTCDHIREWMGNVAHIRVVAKYAARLGQCFSTTRALTDSPISKRVEEIDDIIRNNWCFTDGVGKISPTLAEYFARPLQLTGKIVPSAFQFRLGGSKGLLVIWPDLTFNKVSLRPSQKKFTAQSTHLEIIKPSRYSVATLNRQTITILSCLGVPDDVFLELQRRQMLDYSEAMVDSTTAMRLLSRFVDQNGITTTVAQMIKDGFMEAKEPFFMCILQVWRAWSLRLLREKARIVVEQGAFVFGCVDETCTLRGYYEPKGSASGSGSKGDFPQIFIQVPRPGLPPDDPNSYMVVTGLCVVGRNPSLHLGDMRVVEAVDVPALHHLRDVVVFPATGDRDIPSMCSGGDLDGDDFFVIWDRNLIPPEQNHPPMIHKPEKPVELERDVQPSDLIAFFVTYMKNDTLSTIAHAHLAQADLLEGGPRNSVCVELARLHSNAVDYPKSGQPAHLKASLRPRLYPHFMEKPGKSYHSRKVLGQLYDVVTKVEFHPSYSGIFDERIIRRFALTDETLRRARIIKRQHDRALRQIMNQREIGTEFEVWSTFVLKKPRAGSDYQMQEMMGPIIASHRDRFRSACIRAAGSHEPEVLYPFIAATYLVTWEAVQVRIRERRDESMPLISFPWIFEQELGRIANMPQEYQVDRIPEISAGAWSGEGEDEAEYEKLLGLGEFEPKPAASDEEEPSDGGIHMEATSQGLQEHMVPARVETGTEGEKCSGEEPSIVEDVSDTRQPQEEYVTLEEDETSSMDELTRMLADSSL